MQKDFLGQKKGQIPKYKFSKRIGTTVLQFLTNQAKTYSPGAGTYHPKIVVPNVHGIKYKMPVGRERPPQKKLNYFP